MKRGGGIGTKFGSAVDRTFFRTVLRNSGRSDAEMLGAEERIISLGGAEVDYTADHFIRRPSTFFMPPSAPRDVVERVRSRRGDRLVVDVGWASDYEPFSSAPEVAHRYIAHVDNRRGAARVWRRRGGGRPVVILIHGYLGGVHSLERYVWPIRRFIALGMDVALFVLPHHGVRGALQRRGKPAFPDSDPRFNVEGFRQAIHDLRTFVRWLDHKKATTIGAMGMSLGGYAAALLATLEPRLGFVVPIIPLVSIPAFARAGGRLNGTVDAAERQFELLERIYRPVSPMSRLPMVPNRGRFVVAGRGDRITPVSEAQRLADHFSAPLHLFAGSHLVHLGRRRAFDEVVEMWKRMGIV